MTSYIIQIGEGLYIEGAWVGIESFTACAKVEGAKRFTSEEVLDIVRFLTDHSIKSHVLTVKIEIFQES